MTATFLELVDLASERLGGAVMAANDDFFAPKENLIKPEAPALALVTMFIRYAPVRPRGLPVV